MKDLQNESRQSLEEKEDRQSSQPDLDELRLLSLVRWRLEQSTSELGNDEVLEAFGDEGDPENVKSGSGEKSRSFVDDPGRGSFEGSEDDLGRLDGMPGESMRGDDGSGKGEELSDATRSAREEKERWDAMGSEKEERRRTC